MSMPMPMPMHRYRSKVVQRTVSSALDADREFANMTFNANEDIVEIPIVLIPRSRLPFRCGMNVPSGPCVLWQKWQKNKGALPPGMIWFWPSWCRISHIVTRTSITYFAPTKSCSTSDNVMVDVELSVTFCIGPDTDAVSNFVYKLGAHRFDELLKAELEQTMRALVCSVPHDCVSDVREEFATSMLSTLRSKFARYGVAIQNVIITDVVLPRDIKGMLEQMIALKLNMEEQEKIQENCLRKLQNEAARSIETIRISNRRKLQEVEAQVKQNDCELLKLEEAARGKAKLEEIKAMADADLALKKCIGDANLEKVKARKEGEALLKKTHLQCQRLQIEAEAKVKIALKKSEAQLDIAESRAAKILMSAEAGFIGKDVKLLEAGEDIPQSRSALILHT